MRRTRDAYRVQGWILNGVTLFAMAIAFVGCGAAIAATSSTAVGVIVGIVLYFWIATRGYDRLTGGE